MGVDRCKSRFPIFNLKFTLLFYVGSINVKKKKSLLYLNLIVIILDDILTLLLLL